MRVNPARHLEELVESVLAQRLYAVEFAWGFTRLEQHLEGLSWAPSDGEEAAFLERLARAVSGLREALHHLRRFTEEVELGELDRGLARARAEIFAFDELQALARHLKRPELAERVFLVATWERPWQQAWEAAVTRHQGETRAVFRCRSCGWELAYVQEVESSQELELPFSELTCPLCEVPNTDEACVP